MEWFKHTWNTLEGNLNSMEKKKKKNFSEDLCTGVYWQ